MMKTTQRGFSIIELMVAVTISLLMLGGMMAVLVNSNKSFTTMSKAGRMLDNASYAIAVLKDDIALAGYYGEYYMAGTTTPNPFPDPCATDAASIQSALDLPLQGYDNYDTTNDFTSTSTTPCIVKDNIVANTDILVVRRASTAAVSYDNATTPTKYVTTTSTLYIQGISNQALIGSAASSAVNYDLSTLAADPTFKLQTKDGKHTQPIHPMMVDIYYVSPCDTYPTNGNCSSTGADGIPTLKRLYLDSNSHWVSEPIAEGIENMQFDYGIDTDGNSIPDKFTGTPAQSDWVNVVSVGIHLLARDVEKTTSYTDTKTYLLGLTGDTTAQNTVSYSSSDAAAAYRHKVFTSTAVVGNVQMRRVLP